MSKKIVVITGSHRKTGNSFAMTDAFIQVAKTKGHRVIRFDAAFCNISGCHDCGACFSNGKACVVDDDFNMIAPHILEADVVVFITPVYWYSIPAQLKCVIDKLYSFFVAGKEISGKEYALITCCEEDDVTVLGGISIPLQRSANLLKWKNVGEILVPGIRGVGDIMKTDGCLRAAALANLI